MKHHPVINIDGDEGPTMLSSFKLFFCSKLTGFEKYLILNKVSLKPYGIE
jgi:hypothetical protein